MFIGQGREGISGRGHSTGRASRVDQQDMLKNQPIALSSVIVEPVRPSGKVDKRDINGNSSPGSSPGVSSQWEAQSHSDRRKALSWLAGHNCLLRALTEAQVWSLLDGEPFKTTCGHPLGE